MSDATTAAPAAPAPDAGTAAPAAAPAAAAPAATSAPAPAATAAPAPAATPAPSAAPAAAKADDKPAGAPESYTDFEVPDGVNVDPAAMESFKALAKELDLPQDKAQRLVSAHVEQQKAGVAKTIDGWKQSAATDKEFGGEKFAENLAVAKTALEKFATPEFAKWLDETGLGFHPEMVRTFYRAGQAISQDGFVAGRSGGEADLAKRFYS